MLWVVWSAQSHKTRVQTTSFPRFLLSYFRLLSLRRAAFLIQRVEFGILTWARRFFFLSKTFWILSGLKMLLQLCVCVRARRSSKHGDNDDEELSLWRHEPITLSRQKQPCYNKYWTTTRIFGKKSLINYMQLLRSIDYLAAELIKAFQNYQLENFIGHSRQDFLLTLYAMCLSW